MSTGTIENVSSPPEIVVIRGLGLVLPAGFIEVMERDSSPRDVLVLAEPELQILILTNKIEIKNERGILIGADDVPGWIDSPDPSAMQQHILTLMLNQRVPNSGERFLKFSTAVTTTQVGWTIIDNFTLTKLVVSVQKIDDEDEFGIRIYDFNDLVTPLYSSGTVLPLNSLVGGINVPLSPTPVVLPPGSYSFSMYRTSGTQNSDFNKVMVDAYFMREV